MKLSGKTAVVSGGGSGIGESIAKALAAEGCRVVIAGRDLEKLKQAAKRISAASAVEIHDVDVADRSSVERLFGWIAEKIGPVHILINAAGINIKNRSMAEMTPDQWDQILAT